MLNAYDAQLRAVASWVHMKQLPVQITEEMDMSDSVETWAKLVR